MELKALKNLPEGIQAYKQAGQRAEQIARYTLTGEAGKADNIRHDLQADCLDIQIKSARATVCTGTTNLVDYLAKDAAKRFAYVCEATGLMYVMNRAEWFEFASTFGTVTRESAKNGGAVKVRLKHQSQAMLQWLMERAHS